MNFKNDGIMYKINSEFIVVPKDREKNIDLRHAQKSQRRSVSIVGPLRFMNEP